MFPFFARHERTKTPPATNALQVGRRAWRLEFLEDRSVPSSAIPQVVEFDALTRTERSIPLDANVREAYDRDAYQTALQLTQEFRGIDDLLASLTAPGSAGMSGEEQVPPNGDEARDHSAPSETVFGSDDRTLVSNTTAYPWRAVGRIQITFPSGSGHGSGVMISPYHFLTAGHCVYDTDTNSWASNLVVTLGRNGTERYYAEANWTTARSWSGWTVDENWEHDWALVTLDRNIGNQTGWLGYRAQTDSYFNGSTLNTAGYPGDIGTPVGTQMYFASGPSGYATTNKVYYQGTMDTFGGQSGSGVWQLESGNRYVVAVHAYGDSGGYNSGTRITSAKFNQLQSWISSDTAPTDRPDLIDWDDWFATDLASTGSTFYQRGETLAANTYIRNNGTASTSSTWYVDFYASTNNTISTADYYLGRVSMSSLTPFNWAAATQYATLPANMPTGSYYIGWLIDPTGNESEFNESNNSGYASSTVTIANAPPQKLIIETVDAFQKQTSSFDLSWYFSDYETSSTDLQYAVVANDQPDLLRTTIQDSMLTLAPIRKALGSATVTIRATDADGGWVDSTFTVDIHKNGYVKDFLDQDGDKYRVRVSGLGGARVTLDDPDGDGRGPIDSIELLSTDAKKSRLQVKVQKADTSEDNGTVNINDISGQGAKSIMLPKSSITGSGITMVQGVGKLVAQDLADSTWTMLFGPADARTSIKVRNIASNAFVYSAQPVKSFRAESVAANAVISVPKMGSLNVSGNFAGVLYVSGAGVAEDEFAVKSLRVHGNVANAFLEVHGSISKVVVGGFSNSSLYAGYSGDSDGSGDFDPLPATIKTFRVTDEEVGFRNSYVIASDFGTVWLRAATTNNGGTSFGFIAVGTIRRLRIVDPEYNYDAANPSLGDFDVLVI